MKGDFSRIVFDPTRHYSGVLHQQGRVWLDSDWNQDVQARMALLQQELKDVVGASGVPAPGTGFQISASIDADPSDFQIAAGHCYVNGLLCVLESNASYLSQPDFPQPPLLTIPTDGSTLTALVYLEAWQRLITYLEDPSLREVALGGPDTSARLKTIAQVKVQPLPAGLGPLSCAQAAQYLPIAGSGTLTTVQPATVQTQTLCQLPDAADYTGRQNLLYRVEIHEGGDVGGSGTGAAWTIALAADALAGATSLTLATALTAAQVGAALNANFLTLSDSSGTSERVLLISISADGLTPQIAGLVNSYLVANSASAVGGVARFKWSSDNASFGVTITGVKADRQTVTLDSLGRDTTTMLSQGDLVEITDDASDLGPGMGLLTYLKTDPDPDQFTVVLNDPLPATLSGSPLILRRWDGLGDATTDTTSPALNLGNGVQIQFGGNDLRPGNYWQFATRVADGSIEALTSAAPAGIVRAWSPLAIVSWGPPAVTSPPSSPPSGVSTSVQDCRNVFPSLINFPRADTGFHIIGLSSVQVVTDANGAITGTSSAPLSNDSNLQITSFGGIDIQCDANVDPASMTRPAFTISVDYPLFGGQAPSAYLQANLAASLSAAGSVISWRPLGGVQAFLNELLQDGQEEGQSGAQSLLARLTVRGNFIWSKDDPSIFLDGEAFAQVQSGMSNVSISLPTGDRRRGGDFDMWFWLVAAPPSVTSIQLDQTGTFVVGATANLVITLSSPALANCSVAVSLNNTNVSSASSPPLTPVTEPTSPPTSVFTLPVGIGMTSVSFPVLAATVGQTNVSAQMVQNGTNVGQSAQSTITISLLTLTGQFGLSPASILVGGTATGTLTISAPAPNASPSGGSGGQIIPLGIDNSAVATVQSELLVAAGSSTVSFTITGVAVGSATITASLGGVTQTALITVQAKAKETKDTKEVTKETKDTSKVIRDASKVQSDKKRSELEQIRKAIVQENIKSTEAALFVGGEQSTAALFHTAVGTQRAFITGPERPDVEDHVLKQADRANA